MAVGYGGNAPNAESEPTESEPTITGITSEKSVGISEVSSASQLTKNSSGKGGTNMYSYENTEDAEKFTKSSTFHNKKGVKSLFNQWSLFVHPGCDDKNDFYDIENSDGVFPKYHKGTSGGRYPTIESLITDFDVDNKPNKPYYPEDFLYAKYYKKIQLNRLITVRRFPFPTYDNLEFGTEKSIKPIAQAITYFGNPTENKLEELTSINGKINWKLMDAAVHEVENNEQSYDESPVGRYAGGIGKGFSLLTGKNNDVGKFNDDEIQAIKTYQKDDIDFTGRVLGPVNVVTSQYIRDRGIGSEMSYKIVFNYELKSYNGINPRLAFLDLICNLLALSYNNAKFWGGANRYFPKQHQYGFFGNQKAFYEGRYGDYVSGVVGQISTGFGSIGDKLSSLVSGIMSGNFSELLDVAKKGGTTFMDLQRAKSRPQVLAINALLTGLPTGEWHMTVGNPYRPILSVGNLICESFDLSLGGNLGVDDFPSELTYTLNLKTARPRDKGDMESLFGLGNGRMYYPPKGMIDMLNMSSAAGSANVKPNGGSLKPESAVITDRVNARSNVDREYATKMLGSVY